MTTSAQAAARVLERLADLPGGADLLAVGRERGDVFLVGGAVRDLLLDRIPRELDVVVEGDVSDAAAALAARLPGPVIAHDRFGTARLEGGTANVDLARARTETYAQPGALPEVAPATVEDDLGRRDFTVNAIAVSLAGGGAPPLNAVEHALEDLDAGILRVLHDQSFSDDPTRLLRMARYAARLGFTVEGHTAQLAADAVAGGALRTVSGARVGAELRLALSEPEPVAALAAMAKLGVLPALHPSLEWNGERGLRMLELLPADGSAGLALLASSALAIERAELAPWLDDLEFTARDREVIVAAATRAADVAGALEAARRPSEIAAVARGAPPEAIALAGALGPSDAATSWLEDLRDRRLEIDGDDLLAAGVTPGPAVGRGLGAALAARLDGELAPGPEAELDVALRAAAAAAE
jgi:tRNA nucleotidyltransferase (CCA-adding enzyme)